MYTWRKTLYTLYTLYTHYKLYIVYTLYTHHTKHKVHSTHCILYTLHNPQTDHCIQWTLQATNNSECKLNSTWSPSLNLRLPTWSAVRTESWWSQCQKFMVDGLYWSWPKLCRHFPTGLARLGYLGEVVEVAVVEGGEDVVELVVRRLPGVQPLLLSDCVQNVTVCKENFSWKS